MIESACSAVRDRTCAHGHAFTYGCLGPPFYGVPVCLREDRIYDERRQVVTNVRIDWRERFAEWKARAAKEQEQP